MQLKTCLIVDDDSSVRDYVKVILEREQYRTIEAENGVQALRLFSVDNGAMIWIVRVEMSGLVSSILLNGLKTESRSVAGPSSMLR